MQNFKDHTHFVLRMIPDGWVFGLPLAVCCWRFAVGGLRFAVGGLPLAVCCWRFAVGGLPIGQVTVEDWKYINNRFTPTTNSKPKTANRKQQTANGKPQTENGKFVQVETERLQFRLNSITF